MSKRQLVRQAAQRILSDEQVSSFDTEYVTDALWQPIRQCIDRDFPKGAFTFLDVGGGNGSFADRVLTAYERAEGTVLELNASILAKNSPHARKQLLSGDGLALDNTPSKYDVIFCNWLLHHLVTDTYAGSLRSIDAQLEVCMRALQAGGRLSIYENAYNGYFDGASGRIIYALTSTPLIAPLIRRLGANTAGVGVCFLSNNQWHRKLSRLGRVEAFVSQPWPLTPIRSAALLLREVRCVHYWVAPRT